MTGTQANSNIGGTKFSGVANRKSVVFKFQVDFCCFKFLLGNFKSGVVDMKKSTRNIENCRRFSLPKVGGVGVFKNNFSR